MGNRTATLKARLDNLCIRYDTPAALERDPLSIPLAYRDPLDQEVAAFVAAHLAYGRVVPMLRAIQGVLHPLGPRPAAWLRAHSPSAARSDLGKLLEAWTWRFHTGSDLVSWLLAWQRLDAEAGSGLEPHFLPRPGESPDDALSRVVQRLRRDLNPSLGTRFSLPDPQEGSACKRWRLFLRWMVRPGWPDLGLWTRHSPQALLIPLDTHVARISRFIGLTRRTTPNGRMALEITEALRRLAPGDPLKYDFALSHLGILGDCPGIRKPATCAPCPLVGVCKAGQGAKGPG